MSLCTCEKREPTCRVHPHCACGCPRHYHHNLIGECVAGENPKYATRVCHGCPEYRPAKMRRFDELGDAALDAIRKDDVGCEIIKSHYRALRAHHIEELTAIYRMAQVHPHTGRIKDNPRMDEEGEKFFQYMLQARGIDHDVICGVCGGYGTRYYSNTSTWRGGMGGAAMTIGVCDNCWGSGSSERPWTNLKDIEERNAQMIAERAVNALAHSCGATFDSAKGDIRQIIDHLDVMQRKRKVDSIWTRPLANGLANILRRAIGDPEKKER